MTTRRTFLSASSLAALAAVSRPSRRSRPAVLRTPTKGAVRDDRLRANDPDLHALAMRALDAAKGAGATYADVRFTTTRRRTFINAFKNPDESESNAVGVRVLAKGAWGFAATSEWTAEGVAQLGRTAVEQAKSNVWAHVPSVDLGTRPPIASGTWQTPIKRDPFKVSPDEFFELLNSIETYRHPGTAKFTIQFTFTFERQDRTFASTDGAYATQSIYTAFGDDPHKEKILPSWLTVWAASDPKGQGLKNYIKIPSVSPTGAGYEVVEALGILDNLPAWIDKALAMEHMKPFSKAGDYDVVFDAYTMASIVSGTFGVALEYDRAVGYEANAGGTSYLAPPDKLLGTPVAPAMVTITADRTLPTGAATVQWDDDGVTPRPTPLVKDGVLVDYATNREFATELAPWYRKQGRSVQSNGCAASENALCSPLTHTPNLVLHPGPDATSLETLLSGIEHGFAFFNGGFGDSVKMDFQQLSGQGGYAKGTEVYTVTNGKLGGRVNDAAFTFKSHDLWQNLVALGGAQTAALCGLTNAKGQPDQSTRHTVNAVAARFQNVRILPSSQL